MSIRHNFGALRARFEQEFATHNLIHVSRSALLHNLDVFTGLTDMSAIPVLKANAYGHGIELVATALADRKIPYIAVDGYFEALRVRKVSSQPVLVMGAILPDNFARMRYDNFAFVVQDRASIEALGRTGKRVKVHLECNTGMNRYGADVADIHELAKAVLNFHNLELEGVMSHLADSDGDDPSTVDQAVQTFDECVDIIRAAGASPTMFHIGQSAGSLRAKSKYANAFRLGIGLYGINPFPPAHALHDELSNIRPALRFTSTITKVTELQPGDRVSYNYTYTAQKPMKISVLPVGYYEGLDRALSNRGVVAIGDKALPIVGRVCMNHTMISLDGTDASVGDIVTVYSDNPHHPNSINAISDTHGLFSYGLLAGLSSDVRRRLVK